MNCELYYDEFHLKFFEKNLITNKKDKIEDLNCR